MKQHLQFNIEKMQSKRKMGNYKMSLIRGMKTIKQISFSKVDMKRKKKD